MCVCVLGCMYVHYIHVGTYRGQIPWNWSSKCLCAARASNTAELYSQLFFLFMHSKTAANGIMLLLRVGFPSSEFSGTPSHVYKVRLLDDSQVKLTMKINLHDNQVRPHKKANQNSPTKTSPQRSYQPFLQ